MAAKSNPDSEEEDNPTKTAAQPHEPEHLVHPTIDTIENEGPSMGTRDNKDQKNQTEPI